MVIACKEMVSLVCEVNNKILRNYWKRQPVTKKQMEENHARRLVNDYFAEGIRKAKTRNLYTKGEQQRKENLKRRRGLL